MSVFNNNFPNDPSVGMQNLNDESVADCGANASVDKKTNKILKKIHKTLKRQIAQNNEILRQNTEQKANPKTQTSTNKQDSFLHRVGNVFLKVLPTLLTTVVSGVCAALFGYNAKFSKNSRRRLFA